jgi:glycosyltransferase involved in cell wall biosynthesis
VADRGEEEDRLRSLAADRDVADRIRFLGFRDDVGDLLAACDVFALPSRSEGLPLALLEAMHSGAAVVATDVGGVPEVVTVGREALLVPPDEDEALASALIRLLEDENLRYLLGLRARRRARERFSVTAMTDAYEELYGWSASTPLGGTT